MGKKDHILYNCQLTDLANLKEPVRSFELNWFFGHRLKRFIKRRFSYIRKLLKEVISQQKNAHFAIEKSGTGLKAGDRVLIKSRKEIEGMLNRWQELKGCGFMEEMWQYCNTEQIVYKKVTRFLDERDYHIHKTNGIVILEGTICQGTIDFGPCDRSCFFFWREEWLDKIS